MARACWGLGVSDHELQGKTAGRRALQGDDSVVDVIIRIVIRVAKFDSPICCSCRHSTLPFRCFRRTCHGLHRAKRAIQLIGRDMDRRHGMHVARWAAGGVLLVAAASAQAVDQRGLVDEPTTEATLFEQAGPHSKACTRVNFTEPCFQQRVLFLEGLILMGVLLGATLAALTCMSALNTPSKFQQPKERSE